MQDNALTFLLLVLVLQLDVQRIILTVHGTLATIRVAEMQCVMAYETNRLVKVPLTSHLALVHGTPLKIIIVLQVSILFLSFNYDYNALKRKL